MTDQPDSVLDIGQSLESFQRLQNLTELLRHSAGASASARYHRAQPGSIYIPGSAPSASSKSPLLRHPGVGSSARHHKHAADELETTDLAIFNSFNRPQSTPQQPSLSQGQLSNAVEMQQQQLSDQSTQIQSLLSSQLGLKLLLQNLAALSKPPPANIPRHLQQQVLQQQAITQQMLTTVLQQSQQILGVSDSATPGAQSPSALPGTSQPMSQLLAAAPHAGDSSDGSLQLATRAPGRTSSDPSAGGRDKGAPDKKRVKDKQTYQLSQLQREVQEKQREILRLLAENSMLRVRHRVLEQVVASRDDQLVILSQHSGGAGDSADSFDSTTSWDAVFASGGSSRSSRGGGSTGGATAGGGGSGVPDYWHLTPDTFRKRHKEFVRLVSEPLLLVDASTQPDLGRVQQLCQLVNEHAYVCMWLALLNPLLIYKVLCINIENAAEEYAPPGHWANVLQRLQLTPEQKKDFLMLYQIFREEKDKVTQERAARQQQLQRGIVAAAGNAVAAAGGHGSHSAAAAVAATAAWSASRVEDQFALLEGVTSTLLKEHVVDGLLITYNKLMTSMQFAKLCVFAYPYYPYIPAVIAALQQETGYGRPGVNPYADAADAQPMLMG